MNGNEQTELTAMESALELTANVTLMTFFL